MSSCVIMFGRNLCLITFIMHFIVLDDVIRSEGREGQSGHQLTVSLDFHFSKESGHQLTVSLDFQFSKESGHQLIVSLDFQFNKESGHQLIVSCFPIQ